MVAPRLSFSVGAASAAVPSQPVAEWSAGRLTLSLATGPELSIGMSGRSTAALVIDGLATDVWVYRSSVLAERLRILPVGQAWGPDGTDDLTVVAVGYRRVVAARHIIDGPPTFTNDDQGDILWALVDHTQSQDGGDLGITQGSTTTGIIRDRTEYRIGDRLGTRMDEMGPIIDGCWWGVDADLVFDARLWTAFATNPVPVVLGQNARKLNRPAGAVAYANVGGAMGSIQHTVPAWHEDPSVLTDPRGRWEAFDSSHGSVTDQATVVGYAEGLVAERLTPPQLWTAEIDVAAYFEGGSLYQPGEFVTIHVPRSAVSEVGIPPVSVNAQVTEIVINFTADGVTDVTLVAKEVS